MTNQGGQNSQLQPGLEPRRINGRQISAVHEISISPVLIKKHWYDMEANKVASAKDGDVFMLQVDCLVI